jgi:serine/threonine protein kinase
LTMKRGGNIINSTHSLLLQVLSAAVDMTQEGGPSHVRRRKRNTKGGLVRNTSQGSRKGSESGSESGVESDKGAAAMPPKAQNGRGVKNVYGWASDIWAVGITCIEMATGRHVFTAGWPAILRLVMEQKPPDLPEHLSDAAKDFISKCLAIQPSERPSAEDLLRHPWFIALDSLDGRSDDASSNSMFELTTSTFNTALSPPPSRDKNDIHPAASWAVSSASLPHAHPMESARYAVSSPSSHGGDTRRSDAPTSDNDSEPDLMPETATWQRGHLNQFQEQMAKAAVALSKKT